MQTVAISWQIYSLTHSAFSLGMIGLFSFLPIVMFGLIGGLVADKVNRRTLLIFSQLVQAVFSIILAFTTQTKIVTPELVYAILFFNTAALTFNAPARQAIIPALVSKHEFMNAVSLGTLGRQMAVIIGPAIAGFMIEMFDLQSIYVFNIVTFVIFVLTLMPLSIEIPKSNATYSFKSVWEGIRFVTRSRIISSTMLLDFFATFFASATTLMPIFAQEVLGRGANGLGILYAAPSIGGAVAGFVLASIKHLKHQGKIIIFSVLIFGLATIGFGVSRNYYLSIFFLMLVGASDIISTVIRNTIRQLVTPDNLRGRMISVNMLFVQGGPQLGNAEAGVLAALTGAPFSVVIGGAGAIVAALLIAYKTPVLHKYQGDEAIV